MDKRVKHSRIVCAAKCILNYGGFDYEGVVANLSLSGALIKLENTIPNRIIPGDKCDMILCSTMDAYPVKYTCKVIRFDSDIIGIEFLELNSL